MKEGNLELFVQVQDGRGSHGSCRARAGERAWNGPACAELPPCPGTARTHGCTFPYQLSNEGVGREFSCPLAQEHFSHKNHPSLSSAWSGAAVSRCLPGLAARPGQQEGAGEALTRSQG